MIVGLSGKICSGKSSLAQVFVERGFTILDADVLGHEVLEEQRRALGARFGAEIAPEGGPVNRRLLGEIVFSNPKALADLEDIVHPEVSVKVRTAIRLNPYANFLIEAALLHRGGLSQLCDFVVWVQAPFWQRCLRARKRDRRSWKDLLIREWAQRSFSIKAFLQDVDIYTVDNGRGLDAARQSLEALLDRLFGVR